LNDISLLKFISSLTDRIHQIYEFWLTFIIPIP
jgi:hypothetical protein